ncbi:MAG TPA: acyloxyacyl hydrolase [Cyclobacteriaceae bacterium]|nr:acyloxyacyl hydrolase [Cyclobacteriaceae bacterium]
MKIGYLAFLFILNFLTSPLKAGENPGRIFFIQPEYMTGINLPIWDFMSSGLRQTVCLSFGYNYYDSTKNWVPYYNFPALGISAVYSYLGNSDVFGNEYSLIPYFLFKTSHDPRKSIDFKLGIGVSYYDKPYHKDFNPDNVLVGTEFNWGFHFIAYKNLLVSRKLVLKTGLGALHASNAHTVIPNFGLNTFILSLAAQFPGTDIENRAVVNHVAPAHRPDKQYFIQARYGHGWHELGGTNEPRGGPSYNVHSYSLSGGVVFKQQLKVQTGFTYRYYDSYYHYIRNTPDSEWETDPASYRENPRYGSSNLFWFLGSEFLLGHIGLDLIGGINLFKPFYREYNEKWEFKKGITYFTARMFPARIGVNYYLVNTSKVPGHNIWIGASVNANFAEADFMELGMGYCWRIK